MADLEVDVMRARLRQRKQLKSLRAGVRWKPPTVEDFGFGTVVAMDQTLTNTGVAVVSHTPTDGLQVTYTAMMRVTTDKTSTDGVYDKADAMGYLMQATLSGSMIKNAPEPLLAVVFERPPVGGHRIESSLLGGLRVRDAVRLVGLTVPTVMVANNSMRSLLTPPGDRTSKGAVKHAVEALIPPESRTHINYWNEHVHDAVGLGLTYLHLKNRSNT